MKTTTHLKRYALAALIVGFSTAGFANQEVTGPTPEEQAAGAAEAQQNAAVASIASDRHGTIAGIVATWASSMSQHEGWEAEFTAGLNGASDAQLLDIQGAASYDAVSAILQGLPAPATLDGVTGTEDLGSLTQDLVYSPVSPCRIFDTRLYGGGAPPTNFAVRNYYVYGSGPTMTAQGGNPAGCFTPTGKGEPVGVSINLAAIAVSPIGHLRVYPYATTIPVASFLNYFSAGNVANSGLITTRYNFGRDIAVYNRNTAHSFADVMGYFYAATFPSRTQTLSIPAEAFVSASGDPVSTSFGTGGAYPATAGSDAMVAPVQIPNGAIITGFTVWVVDNVAGSVSITLFKRLLNGNSFPSIGTVTSSGASTAYQQLNSPTLSAIVNNSTTGYVLRAYSSPWPGNSNLKIGGARVTYTYTY